MSTDSVRQKVLDLEQFLKALAQAHRGHGRIGSAEICEDHAANLAEYVRLVDLKVSRET